MTRVKPEEVGTFRPSDFIKHYGWVQGISVMFDIDGRPEGYCVTGACAAWQHHDSAEVTDRNPVELVVAMDEALRGEREAFAAALRMQQWNDRPERNEAEVIELLEAAEEKVLGPRAATQ